MPDTLKANQKVFIVEDGRLTAFDLQQRLKRLGYDVVGIAESADQAMEDIAASDPDVILMDIKLKGDIDGIDLAIAVSEISTAAIVFLTSYADEETFRRAQMAKPHGFLLKPVSERELDISLRTVLQRNDAQKSLLKSEIRYRTLFEKTHEALIIFNNNGEILEANEAAKNLFELQYLEGQKITLKDYLPSSTHQKMMFRWLKFLKTGDASGNYKLTRPFGADIYVEYQVTANFIKNKHLAVLNDVTERQQAQREMKALARLTDNAPEPILTINANGDLQYANKKAMEWATYWKIGYEDRLPQKMLTALQNIIPGQLQKIEKLIGKDLFDLIYIQHEKGKNITIYGTNITEINKKEALSDFQSDLLELVAKGLSSAAMGKEIVKRVAALLPESMAAMFMLPAHENDSYKLSTHILPEEYFHQFFQQFSAKGSGPVAETVKTGLAIAVEDIEVTYKNEAFLTLFRKYHIRALYVKPVKVDHAQLPYFLVVYWRKVHKVSVEELKVIDVASQAMSLALGRDETYRNLVLQALVFNNINDCVIMISEDGHITEWNPTAEKVFGYSKSEIIGQPISTSNLFNKHSRIEKLIKYAKEDHHTANNTQWKDLVSFRTKSGLPGIGEVSMFPLQNAEINMGTLCVMRDVTSNVEVQNKLSSTEANLVSLIENTNDAIVYLDTSFNIVTANKSFFSLFEDVKKVKVTAGANILTTLKWAEANRLQRIAKTVLGGKSVNVEYQVRIDANKLLDFDASFNPIYNDATTVVGISVFARDITERKKAETELKQSNFELDSFVYRASHDLRAPLRSVLGLVNLMRIDTEGIDKPNYLNLVEKSVLKLDSFIADLTDFSRNNRTILSRQTINLQLLLLDVQDNLRYMDGFEGITIQTHIRAEADFVSDFRRLTIILQNIISNAIKYRSIDRLAHIDVFATFNISHATIVITDNGKGIDPIYLNRIFEMFFRASEDSFGSGLGLYITKQVVENMAGTITVKSTLGKGTSVTVNLPNLSASLAD